MAPLIAVLDDDPAFLNLMNVLLTQEGYQTLAWRENQDALTLIRRERPDLLIMDLRLVEPESGWVLLEKLRRDPETLELPVIVCSGDADALRRNAGVLQALRCAVLEKPFDLDDLLETVRRVTAEPGGASAPS
ncbi:MAG TPA: response regulator [Dehalococcoidia bacterium]